MNIKISKFDILLDSHIQTGILKSLHVSFRVSINCQWYRLDITKH